VNETCAELRHIFDSDHTTSSVVNYPAQST
jgi:hypothetical protein